MKKSKLFAHLKPGTDYDNLYQSALCRAQADWLVGINATRLFSMVFSADHNRKTASSPVGNRDQCR